MQSYFTKIKGWLGVTADIIAVLGFLGLGSLGIFVAFFNPSSSSAENRDLPQAVKEETIKPTDPIHSRVQPSTKVKDSGKIINTPPAPPKLVDTVYISKLSEEKTDSLSSQVLSFSKRSTNETLEGSSSVLSMSETPPREGYGKLALRLYANYIKGPGHCRILTPDSAEVDSKGICSYEPEYKWSTTTTFELLPGTYIVEINFPWIGTDHFKVKLFAGKISLYKFNKTNPYGAQNGKLIFLSKDLSSKWEIIVNDENLGIHSLTKKRGIGKILPPGRHTYSLSRKPASELNLNNTSNYLYLKPGEKHIIYIE